MSLHASASVFGAVKVASVATAGLRNRSMRGFEVSNIDVPLQQPIGSEIMPKMKVFLFDLLVLLSRIPNTVGHLEVFVSLHLDVNPEHLRILGANIALRSSGGGTESWKHIHRVRKHSVASSGFVDHAWMVALVQNARTRREAR